MKPPILRIPFTPKESETLRHARSLAKATTITWLNQAIKAATLEFTPCQRETTANLVRELATSIQGTVKPKRQRAALSYLSNLAKRIATTSLILPTNLCPITRDSASCTTTVYITTGENYPRDANTRWLTFGRASLRLDLQPVQLHAFLDQGATDFEHDSAKALVLPLVAVTLDSVRDHTTTLTAVVASRVAEDFRVPWPDYDPLQEAHTCDADSCKNTPHSIVPENCYVPSSNPLLYKEVEGRHVRIMICHC